MSGNISVVSGREEMFYVGKAPWHGLGLELDNPATAEEAIKAGGLDWEVELRKIKFEIPDLVTMGDFASVRATVRADVNAPLGVVTPQYQPIQNREAFGFFDSVVGEGQAIYHTAGALGQGEKIWMLAKLPDEIKIANDKEDVTEKYMLLTTGHDGKSSLKMFFTPVRVVCQNTLNMALQDSGQGITIQHRGNVKSKVDEAKRILGIAIKHYEKFEEQANWLSEIIVSDELARQYVETLFPALAEGTERQANRVEAVRTDVMARYAGERGKSLWHLTNAAVEYVDHGQTFKRSQRHSVGETRFKNVISGNGARMKGRAFDLARTVAETGEIAAPATLIAG